MPAGQSSLSALDRHGFSGSALPAEKILRGRRGVSDDGIGRLETGAAQDPAGRGVGRRALGRGQHVSDERAGAPLAPGARKEIRPPSDSDGCLYRAGRKGIKVQESSEGRGRRRSVRHRGDSLLAEGYEDRVQGGAFAHTRLPGQRAEAARESVLPSGVRRAPVSQVLSPV